MSKEFTLDTTEENFEKKDKRLTVDFLLATTLAVMDIETFILNLKTDKH